MTTRLNTVPRRMPSLLAALFLTGILGIAGNAEASPGHYHDAKQALSEQNYDRYYRHLDRMGDYILRPLVESKYLIERMDRVKSSEIESFLDEYSDTYPSNQLRIAYLNHLLDKKR